MLKEPQECGYEPSFVAIASWQQENMKGGMVFRRVLLYSCQPMRVLIITCAAQQLQHLIQSQVTKHMTHKFHRLICTSGIPAICDYAIRVESKHFSQ